MELTQRPDGVWALSGYIDFDNATAVRDRVQAALGQETSWTLDLAGLEEAGSIVVALMLAWCRSAAVSGATVRYVGVPDSLVRLISFVGLQDLMPVNGDSEAHADAPAQAY